nr:amidohydrolase family protein [Amylibacter sp.]
MFERGFTGHGQPQKHKRGQTAHLLQQSPAKDWVLTGPAIGVIITSIEALEGANDTALAPQIDELKKLYDDNCWTHAEMRKRSIPVVIGGDYGFSVNPQDTNANDLVHFVEHYGFSTAETLHAATAIGARAMNRADELGQIHEGFLADLLLVDGNPLDDISILTDRANFHAIIKDGQFHHGPHEGTLENRTWRVQPGRLAARQ